MYAKWRLQSLKKQKFVLDSKIQKRLVCWTGVYAQRLVISLVKISSELKVAIISSKMSSIVMRLVLRSKKKKEFLPSHFLFFLCFSFSPSVRCLRPVLQPFFFSFFLFSARFMAWPRTLPSFPSSDGFNDSFSRLQADCNSYYCCCYLVFAQGPRTEKRAEENRPSPGCY